MSAIVSKTTVRYGCRICSQPVKLSFENTVLNRYSVQYFYCQNCGFIQTEDPYWINDLYLDTLDQTDTGVLSRSINISTLLACFLYFALDKNGRYVDIGGGYGILVRLMRDFGFDFYWDDAYCMNMFARGFELSGSMTSFDAFTCFEVLEHIPSPLAFLEETFARTRAHTAILSTELFHGSPPEPQDWWYYSFETGQHISFFQKMTFEYMANKLGLNFYSNRNIHILTRKKLSGNLLQILTGKLSHILVLFVQRMMTSRTLPDCDILKQSVIEDRECQTRMV